MQSAPSLPSLAHAEALDPLVVAALRASTRRIVIVGAGGWIGKALLAGLWHVLGRDGLTSRVACFGSSARAVNLGAGRSVAQRPLEDLRQLPPMPTVLFHLAFLTKDKIAGIAEVDYVDANRRISQTVHDALDLIEVDRLFVASSGAARFADDATAAYDLRLYGALKRDDERLFARWAEEAPGRRAMIMRLFSLAGPFINKHETYALANFVLDALAGRPIRVTAPMAVQRGYVAVREAMSLALAALLDGAPGEPVIALDSGGKAMELADVAQTVARRLGGRVDRAPITRGDSNLYIPDAADYETLLTAYRLDSIGLEQAVAETAAYLAQDCQTGARAE
jgi:nucleoside-diphosphate-sugar epimerase